MLIMLSFRKDRTGYVVSSTSWDEIGNAEVNAVAVVKLTGNLDVQWSKKFGMAGGNSQGRYSVLFKFLQLFSFVIPDMLVRYIIRQVQAMDWPT